MNRSRLVLVLAAVVIVPLLVHAALQWSGLWPRSSPVISVLVGVALLLFWVPGNIHSRSLLRTLEIVVVGGLVIYLLGAGVRAAESLTVEALLHVVTTDAERIRTLFL